MPETLSVWHPYVQFGAVGLCFVLLAIVVWQIWLSNKSQKTLIDVIERNNAAFVFMRTEIATNTEVHRQLIGRVNEIAEKVSDIHENIDRCPCAQPFDRRRGEPDPRPLGARLERRNDHPP